MCVLKETASEKKCHYKLFILNIIIYICTHKSEWTLS